MRIKIASLILCVLFLMTSCRLNTVRTESSDKMIINKIRKIVKEYESSKPMCSLLEKAELSWLESSNNKGNSVVTGMGENDYVLDISFKAKNTKARANPLEIYAIFNCFMELQKQQLEYNVVAIACSYSHGLGIDDASSWLIIITYDEFESLHNNSYNAVGDSDDLAKKLGDMWINKEHYNRFGLKFEDADNYRELLITPWNINQLSFNKEFAAGYFYGGNKLSVDKINRYNDDVSSTQTIWSIQIGETGFLYGAWDEQNNVWLYGEDIGIRLYKFDGDINWKQSDYTDGNQIPCALKKVMETKE
ncbi:MAG: hypothetical protein WCX81_03015 [Monoglobales bacterium]